MGVTRDIALYKMYSTPPVPQILPKMDINLPPKPSASLLEVDILREPPRSGLDNAKDEEDSVDDDAWVNSDDEVDIVVGCQSIVELILFAIALVGLNGKVDEDDVELVVVVAVVVETLVDVTVKPLANAVCANKVITNNRRSNNLFIVLLRFKTQRLPKYKKRIKAENERARFDFLTTPATQ